MIRERLREVQERIASACRRAGRDPSDVTVICVTKQVDVARIQEAIAAGARHVGENRVQEARPKRAALAAHPGVRWHLIGHLQRNKARLAVQLFDVIHSVDSAELAQKLEQRVGPKTVEVLVEVNTSAEASKYGVRPEEAGQLVSAIRQLPHLQLTGLMTMAPIVKDPEEARPYFQRLRMLRDALGLTQLSMGMSQDYETAIEEGATMVRIGTAIFGSRT